MGMAAVPCGRASAVVVVADKRRTVRRSDGARDSCMVDGGKETGLDTV